MIISLQPRIPSDPLNLLKSSSPIVMKPLNKASLNNGLNLPAAKVNFLLFLRKLFCVTLQITSDLFQFFIILTAERKSTWRIRKTFFFTPSRFSSPPASSRPAASGGRMRRCFRKWKLSLTNGRIARWPCWKPLSGRRRSRKGIGFTDTEKMLLLFPNPKDDNSGDMYSDEKYTKAALDKRIYRIRRERMGKILNSYEELVLFLQGL